MIINKYQGKTKEEAIELAKKEMGPNVVIMNAKEIAPKGLAGMLHLRQGLIEVTAAIEEKDAQVGFTAVADEKIDLSATAPLPSPRGEDWAGALSELSKIVEKNPDLKDKKPATYERPVVKQPEMAQRQSEQAAKQPEMAQGQSEQAVKQPVPSAAAPEASPAVRPEKSAMETFAKSAPHISAHESSGNVIKAEGASFFSDGKSENAAGKTQGYIKTLYNTLLDHEMDEKYINQVMEEVEKTLHQGSSLDYLVSNVYQKMVLMLGKPKVISLARKKPKVVFFIGPTGVGKTTTIAKIAATFLLEKEKEIALLTADTYRIAAAEQLQRYADILHVPVSIVYSPEDINAQVEKYADMDLILVDTAGFSHKNNGQKEDMKKLIANLDESYEKSVYLVLSATTKYRDLLEIADTYKEIAQYDLIFTKLDETNCYGNIMNLRLYTGSGIGYATTGQNVPGDIEVIDTQKIVKQLLGGK